MATCCIQQGLREGPILGRERGQGYVEISAVENTLQRARQFNAQHGHASEVLPPNDLALRVVFYSREATQLRSRKKKNASSVCLFVSRCKTALLQRLPPRERDDQAFASSSWCRAMARPTGVDEVGRIDDAPAGALQFQNRQGT